MSDGDARNEPIHVSNPQRMSPWAPAGCAVVVVLGIILLYGAAGKARTEARMSTSMNNLKQIGLALHNYHDVYKQFPPSAIVDAEGLPYHGWIYSILPYLDCSPLFSQINGHRPWNDPVNAEKFHIVMPVMINPAIPEKKCEDGFGYTHYMGSSRIFKVNGSLTLGDITDGPRNTIMVGEINEGFAAWGTPGNTRDPAKGLNKGPDTFGSPFEGGVHFLFADGRVQFVRTDIDPAVLKAYATPAGDEDLKSLVGD